MLFSGFLQLHGLTCRCPLYLQLMTTGGRVCKDNAAVTLVLGSFRSCPSQTQHQMVLFSFLWTVAKPVMLCCSCWTSPAQLQVSCYSALSTLLGTQRSCGRGIIWLSWEVPPHICEGHIPTWHPATSCSFRLLFTKWSFYSYPKFVLENCMDCSNLFLPCCVLRNCWSISTDIYQKYLSGGTSWCACRFQSRDFNAISQAAV